MASSVSCPSADQYMYQTLKRFLPPPLRRRYAPALRALAALPYRGGTYQCNLCGTGLRTFIELLPRYRAYSLGSVDPGLASIGGCLNR